MLGTIAIAEDDPDHAEKYFIRAFDYFKTSPFRHNAAMVYVSLGQLAERRKDLVLAREQFDEALKISTFIRDASGIGNALESIAGLDIAGKRIQDGMRQYLRHWSAITPWAMRLGHRQSVPKWE